MGRVTQRRRQRHPTPVLLPGKSYGRRSLVGCSPWGRWGSDTTERLHFHFSLSCRGEGNGNPLQCSCLENPRDRGAWWAAISGVTHSWTRLKWLSSSSSRIWYNFVFLRYFHSLVCKKYFYRIGKRNLCFWLQDNSILAILFQYLRPDRNKQNTFANTALFLLVFKRGHPNH